MQFVDVHAHLFDANMPVTPAEAIAAAQAVGVAQFVVPGLDVTTSKAAIALGQQFPGVCFPTIGIHPHEVLIPDFDLTASIGQLSELLSSRWKKSEIRIRKSETNQNPEIRTLKQGTQLPTTNYKLQTTMVGIGEIGIDYHHHTREETGKVQREAFATQLALGAQHDLPIIVHGRKAYDDVLDVIRAHPGSRGLLHSFEADYEVARQALDLGWIISFTALVTYPGNEYLLDVANKLPLDRITVETDAPYLPPQSIRIKNQEVRSKNIDRAHPSPLTPHSLSVIGKRGINNQPAYMVETAQALAVARGISLEEFAAATTHTARTLFQLSHQ